MPEAGYVVEVNVDPQGSELDAPALSTDTVLVVADASTYDAPGTIEINDTRADFTDADEDAGTLTLAAALGVAGDIGDRVFVIAADEIAYDYSLEVMLADGSPAEIPLPLPSDRLMWQPGPVIPPIPVTVTDDLTALASVPGRVPQVSGTALDIPRAWGTSPAGGGFIPHGQTIPDTTWTAVGWNGIGSGVEVPHGGGTGWAPQTAGLWTMTANVGWTANGTGSRRIRFRYDDPDGGTYYSQPFTLTSPAPAAVTVSAFTQTRPLEAGAVVSVEVYQASGADLDLDRGVAENWGEFSMFRLGS